MNPFPKHLQYSALEDSLPIVLLIQEIEMPENQINDDIRGLHEAFVPVTIHLHLILDVSPSMKTRWSQTISGLNEYLDSLRKDQADNDQPYKVTITTFSATVKKIYDEVELDNIPTFTEVNFQPSGYGTALYDAVGKTVTDIKEDGPVLIVILTDGEENSSAKWNETKVSTLLDERQKLGNYTYAYLGVAKEGWGNAATMGNAIKGSSRNTTAGAYGASTYTLGANSLASRTCSFSSVMRSNTAAGGPAGGAPMSVSQFFDDSVDETPEDSKTTTNK